jgi:amidase
VQLSVGVPSSLVTQIHDLSAREQAAAIRDRELSPVDVTEHYLNRIDRLADEVGAFVTVTADIAREQAKAAEKAVGQGETPPLLGVPVPIKDLNMVKDVPMTLGSAAFDDFQGFADDNVVTSLREAGTILLGKTNTPEFGLPCYTENDVAPPARTPWDLSRSAGGSSGGAAAAVAAGLAPIAQGSDGGGSIRIPASCCGLFGIKPARGRVSPAPYGGLEGFSTSGPIARSVLDAAALLDVLAGYETGDPYWAPPPERPFTEELGADPGCLRVALTTMPPIEAPVAPECASAAGDAGRLLEELGHSVDEATPRWQDAELMGLFMKVWAVIPALYNRPAELFEPETRALIEAASYLNAVDYVAATARLRDVSRRIVAFFDDYELLLTPTLAQPPVPIGALEDDDPWVQFANAGRFTPFTQAANITGLPAVSLPLAWSDDGLPIGVQLVGRPAGEAVLFRVSAQVEEARPWRDRQPPVA